MKRKTGSVENRGIQNIKGKISTYRQQRNSFHYFYAKRTILEDGISTAPLEITLTPWVHTFVVLDEHDPLSLAHSRPLDFDGKTFHSAKQLLLYKQAVFAEDLNVAQSILKTCVNKELFQISKTLVASEEWLTEALVVGHRIIEEKHKQWAINADYFLSLRSQCIVMAGWDRFWECGMEKRHAEVANPNEFPGENSLGKLIASYVSQLFS